MLTGWRAVYAIGLFGAWYYYISRARSFQEVGRRMKMAAGKTARGVLTGRGSGYFQEGALGFVKGFVWPAFLVYALLKSLDGE